MPKSFLLKRKFKGELLNEKCNDEVDSDEESWKIGKFLSL